MNEDKIELAKCSASVNFRAKLCYAHKYRRKLMVMFTYNHVVAHRAKVVKAVAERDFVSLLLVDGPLEPHQERVGEDFAGRDRGNQHRRSEALQPHVSAAATGG
ncbi:jg8110 [Pararge aegeria aegeria]|uniref:Jg8110 protein n=1 Tax=Pararge aegeria aegeria TaxID=348720 RepID=A0A8S4SFE3_9NEOP|nr:jg8110 [Pararge aegeria aegeria]